MLAPGLYLAVAVPVVPDLVQVEDTELTLRSVIGGNEVPFQLPAIHDEGLEAGRCAVRGKGEASPARRLPPDSAYSAYIVVGDVCEVREGGSVVRSLGGPDLVGVAGNEMNLVEAAEHGRELLQQFLRRASVLFHTGDDRGAVHFVLVIEQGRMHQHDQRGAFVRDGLQVAAQPVHLVVAYPAVVVALSAYAFIAVYAALVVAVNYVVQHYVVHLAQVEGVPGRAHGPAIALRCLPVHVSLALHSSVVVVVAHCGEHRHREVHGGEGLREVLDGIKILVPVAVVAAVSPVQAIDRQALGDVFVPFFIDPGHERTAELRRIVVEIGQVYVTHRQEGVVVVGDRFQSEVVAFHFSIVRIERLPELRHSLFYRDFRASGEGYEHRG